LGYCVKQFVQVGGAWARGVERRRVLLVAFRGLLSKLWPSGRVREDVLREGKRIVGAPIAVRDLPLKAECAQ